MDQFDEDFNYNTPYKALCTGVGFFLKSSDVVTELKDSVSDDQNTRSHSTNLTTDDLMKRKKLCITKHGTYLC